MFQKKACFDGGIDDLQVNPFFAFAVAGIADAPVTVHGFFGRVIDGYEILSLLSQLARPERGRDLGKQRFTLPSRLCGGLGFGVNRDGGKIVIYCVPLNIALTSIPVFRVNGRSAEVAAP